MIILFVGSLFRLVCLCLGWMPPNSLNHSIGPWPMALLLCICWFPLLCVFCLFFWLPPIYCLSSLCTPRHACIIRAAEYHRRSVSPDGKHHCLIVGSVEWHSLSLHLHVPVLPHTGLVCVTINVCICLTANQMHTLNLTLLASKLYTCSCISAG